MIPKYKRSRPCHNKIVMQAIQLAVQWCVLLRYFYHVIVKPWSKSKPLSQQTPKLNKSPPKKEKRRIWTLGWHYFYMGHPPNISIASRAHNLCKSSTVKVKVKVKDTESLQCLIFWGYWTRIILRKTSTSKVLRSCLSKVFFKSN